jgi:hypothetical protein
MFHLLVRPATHRRLAAIHCPLFTVHCRRQAAATHSLHPPRLPRVSGAAPLERGDQDLLRLRPPLQQGHLRTARRGEVRERRRRAADRASRQDAGPAGQKPQVPRHAPEVPVPTWRRRRRAHAARKVRAGCDQEPVRGAHGLRQPLPAVPAHAAARQPASGEPARSARGQEQVGGGCVRFSLV